MKGGNEYSIQITAGRFWDKKKRFLMPCDRYATWTMFAVEEGAFRYRINDSTGTAINEDVVICPPGVEFHREVVSDTLSFYYVNFVWRGQNEEQEKKMRAVLERIPQNKFRLMEGNRIFNYLKRLRKLTDRYQYFSQKIMEHLINEIWLLLCLEMEENERKQRANHDRTMSEVKLMLEKKAFKKFYLKDLAAELHLSTVQLTRRFYDSFGINPMEYVTSLRMQKAKTLLTETNYTIDHIAQLCGYDNGFYLSRVFSGKQHMSPSEYRRTHRV